jgi:hypothetical protein
MSMITDSQIPLNHSQIILKLTANLQPGNGNHEEFADHDRYIALSLEALRVERKTAIRLRDEGRINDEVLRRIERELDLNESTIEAINQTYTGRSDS